MSVAASPQLLARSVRREVFVESSATGDLTVRKEFLARTPLRRVRELLKGALGRAASQREARALDAMANVGVRAPRLVAESATGPGTRRIVQTFVAGVRLVDCLDDPRRRRVVLARVGAELRRAHEAGWVHRDLHEENVLVEGDEPTLIDWQRARPDAHRDDARIWDVARFEHSMWLLGVPLGDRMRFRRAALGVAGPRAGGEVRARLRAVGPVVRRRARSFAAVRTRRIMRAEDGRTRVELDGLRGLRLGAIGEVELRAALEAHERLDAESQGRVTDPIGRLVEKTGELVLKRDHRAVITAVQVGERSFVVKEVRKAGLRRRLADAWRGSPARRSFRAGHGLRLRGIGTAEPLAWLERRRLGVPVASWLVLEDLRGLWPAAEPGGAEPETGEPNGAAASGLEHEASRPAPAAVADALARMLVCLHAADVSHGDLQALHVLLRPVNEASGRVEALLIDCDGVRFEAGLRDAERVREIAALNASIPGRLLSVEHRRGVFDRVARRVPFEAPPGEVLRQVVQASLDRDQQWRGEGCAHASPAGQS